jgi:hypothetical protein
VRLICFNPQEEYAKLPFQHVDFSVVEPQVPFPFLFAIPSDYPKMNHYTMKTVGYLWLLGGAFVAKTSVGYRKLIKNPYH